jgi:hypothetical protein
MHAPVQRQVLGLVRQRVDVRARVLGHDYDARRARARLGGAACVVAVQEVVEAGLVGGMRWSACIPKLL